MPWNSHDVFAAAASDCVVFVVGGDVVGGGSIVLVFTAGHVRSTTLRPRSLFLLRYLTALLRRRRWEFRSRSDKNDKTREK